MAVVAFGDAQVDALVEENLLALSRVAGVAVHIDPEPLAQRIVDVAVRVWWVDDVLQKFLECRHLGVSELAVAAEQPDKRRVEFLDALAVAAPVKRLGADDVLE